MFSWQKTMEVHFLHRALQGFALTAVKWLMSIAGSMMLALKRSGSGSLVHNLIAADVGMKAYRRSGQHYSDVIISAMSSQITGVSMFTQPFVQTQIKENIKAPRHWHLWTGEFPAQMASNAKNVPFDDVIMYRGLSYSILINTKLGCQIISWCGAMINVSWSFPTRILLGFSWHFEMTCKDTLSDNSPVTGEFPAQRVSNAENVSIWWRHHEEFLSGASCGNMDRLRYLDICTKPTVTK